MLRRTRYWLVNANNFVSPSVGHTPVCARTAKRTVEILSLTATLDILVFFINNRIPKFRRDQIHKMQVRYINVKNY